MDIFNKNKRREIMKAVKCKDSKMEVTFRKALWRDGFRYSKNSSKYFGKPDLVLKKYKTVVFLDSCFWHGCSQHGTVPATRSDFWKEKIERNRERDKEVNRYYKKIHWMAFRLWEHNITKNLDRSIRKLEKYLVSI
jgi:DNA mismatch endonuclease (patch repair protein)